MRRLDVLHGGDYRTEEGGGCSGQREQSEHRCPGKGAGLEGTGHSQEASEGGAGRGNQSGDRARSGRTLVFAGVKWKLRSVPRPRGPRSDLDFIRLILNAKLRRHCRGHWQKQGD